MPRVSNGFAPISIRLAQGCHSVIAGMMIIRVIAITAHGLVYLPTPSAWRVRAANRLQVQPTATSLDDRMIVLQDRSDHGIGEQWMDDRHAGWEPPDDTGHVSGLRGMVTDYGGVSSIRHGPRCALDHAIELSLSAAKR